MRSSVHNQEPRGIQQPQKGTHREELNEVYLESKQIVEVLYTEVPHNFT